MLFVARLRRCCRRRRSCIATTSFLLVAAALLVNNFAKPLDRDNKGQSATAAEATVRLFKPTDETAALKSTATSVPATSSVLLVGIQPRLPTESEFYQLRSYKVNEYRYSAIMAPNQLCRNDTQMIVLVHSSPVNADRRAAIRSTWGEAVRTGRWPNENHKQSCAGLRLAFVLGLHGNDTVNRAVREEHAQYDDIVQGDFVDSYRNMTLKSLLDLKIVDERCPKVKYLLKSDDDMVINFPYLLDILLNLYAHSVTRFFLGPHNPHSRPFREGVWKLTMEEFPFRFYPPYESGSAYVITGNLVRELFVAAEYVPHIFVDDVYITGILGRILNVKHMRQRGFAFWGSRIPYACDLVRRKIVTGTKMDPQRLRNLWSELQHTKLSKCPRVRH